MKCDRLTIDRNAEPLHDLQRRQLPQPAEQPLGPAPDQHDLAARGDPHQRPREHRQLALLLATRQDRQLGLPARARRHAVLRDRTYQAARLARGAHGRAELHQALVEIARRRVVRQRGHQLAGVTPQRLQPGGRLDVLGQGEHAPEHPGDVAIDERGALAERDRRDRPGGVRPDAGHLAQLRGPPGQRAVPARADRLRARPQVARPRVVAEPRPRREHVVERRPRERGHRREPRHPALPVRDHRGDAGLLQHDLADPDRVRIARAAPRQVTLDLAIVRDHGGRDRAR